MSKVAAPDQANVEDRLQKLEVAHRRLKRLGTVLVFIISALFLMGQAAPKRTIEAEEIVLRDSSGNRRAMLYMRPGGASLAFLDANGTGRAAIGVFESGPSLVMSDQSGKQRILLTSDSRNFLDDIAFWDSNGELRIMLGHGNEGTSLALYDKQGSPLWIAPSEKSGKRSSDR